MRTKLLLVLGALVGSLLLSEGAFRLVEPRFVSGSALRDMRNFLLTGVPRQFELRAYTAFKRPVAQGANSFGYLDREWQLARTPGVPRILCIGGSTTEGGNPAGPEGAYPFFLEQTLERAAQRDFEVLNAGISGWTSAEGLIAWFLELQDLAPDLVLIHFAVNDLLPRFLANFKADYSHWRAPTHIERPGLLQGWLLSSSDLYVYLLRRSIPSLAGFTTRDGPPELRLKSGRFPPETAAPYVRNLRNLGQNAVARGVTVALMTMPKLADREFPIWVSGIADNNRLLRELAAEEGYLLIDAERAFDGRPELQREFLDTCHLTPAGNEAKARVAAEFLLQHWVPTLAK